MLNVGFGEIVVILIIALVVFGPKKLPEIGKSLGQGLREFKRISNDLTSSITSIDEEIEKTVRDDYDKKDGVS